jgi:uncharacterized protein YqhQ
MLVSIFVFALIPHHLAFGYKVASRVVFIPLIAGLSYEIIRFADQKRENRGIQYFIKPGLWLQRLTAREPSEAQIEVALCALKGVLEAEGHVVEPSTGYQAPAFAEVTPACAKPPLQRA